jgi:hypothetical protein
MFWLPAPVFGQAASSAAIVRLLAPGDDLSMPLLVKDVISSSNTPHANETVIGTATLVSRS